MFKEIPLAAIRPNPGQPRALFDEAALDELADSIRTSGLLQPIVVRPDGDVFEIVAGERRWRACQRAGLTLVPAHVRTGLDDEAAYVASVAENVNRRDMTIMEEARAFAHLRDLGRTPAEMAALFGKTKDYITWRLGFLSLTAEVSALVESGAIKPTLAYFIARCEPANQAWIVTRHMRGDFPTESEASAFAQAVKRNEDQPAMFLGDLSDEGREQRQVTTAKTRKELDRIGALTELLAEIGGTDPMDLAAALAGRTSAEAARMEDVYRMALKARKALRSAKAISQAATLSFDDEAVA